MANMDHYENGKWVGSTKVSGHSNTTGWVNTYSSDGKVRSTWVSNTDQFDYKEGQHREKSIEEIQSSRAASETWNEIWMKIMGPVLKLGYASVILTAIVSIITIIKVFGLEELKKVFTSEEFILFVICFVPLILFFLIIYLFRRRKEAKQRKQNKEKEKNQIRF